MNINKASVDVIPTIENGDFKKVYDYGITKFNKIVLALIHQLYMPTNTLDDFSDLGCLHTLLNIYFSEKDDLYSIAGKITENLKKYTDEDLEFHIDIDPDNRKLAHVNITLNNVPNFRFKADIIQQENTILLTNTEYEGATEGL